jgi:phosphatidylethanolamine-binding protein (PEBP) family uncharacterized protein
VTNVPGKQADSRAGKVLTPYHPPSKHQGHSGVHRYVLAVLEQPGDKPLQTVPAPKHRTRFSMMDYAKQYKLDFVGATFFYGSWGSAGSAAASRHQHHSAQMQHPSQWQQQGSEMEKQQKKKQPQPQMPEGGSSQNQQEKLNYAKSMMEKSNLLKELIFEGNVHWSLPLTLHLGGDDVSVEPGDEVEPHITDKQPIVTFTPEAGKKAQALYTLMMVDPDFPSLQQPSDRSVLLTLVKNIPGTEGDSRVGDVVVPYMPPSDLPGGTGTHRYLCLLMEQHMGPLEEEAVAAPEHRSGFDVHGFMKKHAGLEIVGGTFFLGKRKD